MESSNSIINAIKHGIAIIALCATFNALSTENTFISCIVKYSKCYAKIYLHIQYLLTCLVYARNLCLS